MMIARGVPRCSVTSEEGEASSRPLEEMLDQDAEAVRAGAK